MNTKTFAQESRKILMQGVAKKLLYWGFNDKGEILEQPEKVSGGYSFRGDVFDDPSVPNLWKSLEIAIKNKGIEVVVEEAAYTWFNRIMALRILVKNGYEEPQLEDAKGLEHTPIILQKARQGKSDFLNADEKTRLQKILADYSKDQEAFAILIKGYCHSHKTLQRVFGKIDDYTELLLPDNMLQTDGFLHLLNTTDAITDEDYQKVELIGWLYQFYISEKKDDVFASFKKGKKAEAKDIPAATQIFTPNWIVKYMVENTAGKIWLDKHPNSALKTSMKYLVENENVIASDNVIARNEAISSVEESLINTVEDLTLIDPAAGSGHILVEGFDLIYKMYLEEYYTAEEAVASILKNNLFGLDIDDRAAQLATFAILLKAAKVFPAIWKKDWLPNVYAMPEAADFSTQELKDFLGKDGTDYVEELDAALRLMQQAKNLGSVMKLDISEDARIYIEERFNNIKNTEFRDFNIEVIYPKLKNYIPVLLLLTKKYTSVVANPPYMGQKNMNADLKNYVKANYPLSKSDLFAVFMESMIDMLQLNARVGCITMESWMFLSSYEKLRNHLLENYSIASLAHFGWHIIGIAFGTATLILEKSKDLKTGEYSYLTIDDVDHEKNVPYQFPKKTNGRFARIPQTNFSKIPSSPIAYWISHEVVNCFLSKKLKDYAHSFQGIITGNNARLLRFWHELPFSNIKLNFESYNDSINIKTWVPYQKGGRFRRWYGNNEYVVFWNGNGGHLTRARTENQDYYFKNGITWSFLTGGNYGCRETGIGGLWDVAGSSFFPDNVDDFNIYLALYNSKVVQLFLNLLNPTMNYQVENILACPISDRILENSVISKFVENNKKNSIRDWDSRETSWDFQQSPLLNNTKALEEAYATWQKEVTIDFFQLHKNEEELNRIFIDIYGLQEELTPEVALKDITILQEELAKKDLEKLEATFRENGANEITLPINKPEVISQFISYAIGLFMGRYRLDKTGLNIAHPNPTKVELASYVIERNEAISSSENENKITIDEDAILPIMGTACNFPDDALQQIYNLLDVIWGAETRTENINFIQECLNKDLEKFLVADFYKYHCKMYKKKPIYWLFASKKGAFQVLVYMHRMNAFTVEKIRDNYLLDHIKNLSSEIELLEKEEASLDTKLAKKLEQLRKNRDECYEYEAELKTVADNQITFDLDDGVTVNYKKFETVVAKIK